jgi:O6-methylguanine-DNA--protein-cysteine methyltransferase
LPDEVKNISNHIKTQVSEIIENPFIGKVSTFDEKIDDFHTILKSVNIDNFIQNLFNEKTDNVINSILLDLKNRKDAIALDFDEINQKITQLVDAQKKFSKELSSEKRKVENKFSSTLLSQILQDVESSLRNSVDRLIRASQVSDDNFSQTVNEIIRPVIVGKIQNYSEKVFADTISNIEINNQDIFNDVGSMLNTTDKVIGGIATVSPILPAVIGAFLTKIITKINPVIFAISTVVSIIATIFSESKEDRFAREEREKQEKLKSSILNNVIPSIPSQISDDIENSIQKVKNEFFAKIEEEFSKKFDEITNSLQKAKNEKIKMKDDVTLEQEKFQKLYFEVKSYI